MHSIWKFGLAALIAILSVSLILFLADGDNSPQPALVPPEANDTIPQQVNNTNDDATTSTADDSSANARIHQAHRQLQAAQAELAIAENNFANAELAFNELEEELAEAENYIENLEAKGEDPANHAEEGMVLLNPLIEKYEDRLAAVQLAETILSTARQKLESAKQTLASAEAASENNNLPD